MRLLARAAVVLPLLSAAASLNLLLAPTISGSAATPQADPLIGPHARDEARHRADRLQFTTATSAPIARQAPRTATNAAGAGAAAPATATGSGPTNEGLRREVFGFAPYWALSGTTPAYTQWNYSLLSTVAFFGLTLDANGNWVQTKSDGTPEPGWTAWNSAQFVDMVNRAHTAADQVVLTIKAFDNTTICSVIYGAAPTTISNTIAAVQAKHLDGVNVDFEGSQTTCGNGQSLQSGLTAFMRQLTTQVHQAVGGSFVTIDTYSGAASWNGGEFNIGDLAPNVDAMFVMAYDMNFANMLANNQDHAGPTAPLNGWTYNDTRSVQQYLALAPSWKVILGVPYYGYKWSTADNQPYSLTTSSASADTYANAKGDLTCTQAASQWDSTASSWWAAWQSPATGGSCGNYSSWRELYYDDATSLGLKYDLVNSNGLRGTGIWALDYQGSSQDLWNEISLKFVSHWEPLGGPIGSAPAAASWGTGRLDAFVRGTDNALWHRAWDGTTWTWERLGGVISAEPGAVSWGSGRLDVFVRGQELALWHRAFDLATGWGPWEDLGGVLGSGPHVSSPAAGQLDVFVRGTDGGLWHRGFGPAGWSNWQNVGVPAVFADSPAPVSAGGQTSVFVRGTDQNLWSCHFDGTRCTGWQPLGGPIADAPAASSWGTARLDVFARGTDSHLWHRWFDGTVWSSWSDAIGVGGVLSVGPGAVSPAQGRIDVFVRGSDAGLWHLGLNIS